MGMPMSDSSKARSWNLLLPGLFWRVAAVGVFAWLALAGERIDERGEGAVSWLSLNEYAIWEHGWPWVFLRRSVSDNPSAWYRLGEGVTQFHGWALAGNVAVLLAVIALLGVSYYRTVWRRQVMRPWWGFSLAQGFVGLTLLCLMLGSVGRSYITMQQNARAAETLERGSWAQWDSNCPRWFSRLRGERWLTGELLAVTRVYLAVPASDSPQMLAALASLNHLRELGLAGRNLTDEDLQRLLASRKTWPIEKLVVVPSGVRSAVNGDGFQEASRLPRLKELQIDSSQLDDKGLVHVARIKSLEQLDLRDTRITGQAIALLAQMPNLKLVRVVGCRIRRADCRILIEQGWHAVPATRHGKPKHVGLPRTDDNVEVATLQRS